MREPKEMKLKQKINETTLHETADKRDVKKVRGVTRR